MSIDRYSLCIPYINYVDGKVDKYIWRVADFDSERNRFIKAVYSDREEIVSVEDYHPRKIRARPFDLEPYKVELRAWKVLQGEMGIYTESERFNSMPIEIVFHEGIDLEKLNSDSDIRSILHHGIPLLGCIGESFLLVVNKTSSNYEALYCSKRDFTSVSGVFRIPKSCQDMSRTTHCFELYTIAKDDLIDTSELNIYFSQYEKAPVRYFYSHLELNRPERKVFLRSPEDYAKAYISKYLKNKTDVLKITKSEIRKMIGMIEDALKNKEEFEAFFEDTGFKFSDVEYALQTLSDEVKEVYMQNDRFSQVVERCLLNDPAVWEKSKEEAKKLWLLENDEQRRQAEDELSALETQLNETKKEREITLSNITSNKGINAKLEAKKETLEQDCREIEAKIEQIKKDIECELKHFQRDIVHLAAISALSGHSASNNSNGETARFIYLSGVTVQSDEPVFADNLLDFTDDLQTNLIIKGLHIDYAYGLAQFIVATIACRKHFIVCGSKSEDVANSLSLLLQSKSADQIFLHSDFTDVASLINRINSVDSNVILIHNALETYSESIFSAVVKLCKNKIIMFSCEDENTYTHLPQHWGQYVSYLSPEAIWDKSKNDEVLTGKFSYEMFKCELKENHQSEFLRILKPFSTKKILNYMQISSMSQTLKTCQTIFNTCESVKLSILNNIYLLTSKGNSGFLECLSELNINDDLKQIICREVSDE